ncbi:TRAPP trafficking subunit Trs65-domain-containing protein [Gautieria morchelliformis]|nr:TRAPP trafficking subunit Trs65-domain-containing protein [Gautieria morchelliformis]
MTSEEIFNSTKLDVIISEGVHELPSGSDLDDWLRSVTSSNQREKAFFDERLLLFFTVKTPHPGTAHVNPLAPPPELAVFLSHLQVTLDAKYISPQPAHRTQAATRGINLAPPPRSHSYKAAVDSPGARPSIFPPYTPHPTPQTGDADRKYAGANANTEGTVLESFVWGETSREEPTGKNFTLMWSYVEEVWVTIYRLTVGVSFLRTSVSEPILSLTISATLRDKPLTMTPGRKELASLVQATGGIPNMVDKPAAVNGVSEPEIHHDELHSLNEVNILDTLSHGPTFVDSRAIPLSFPSTRLSADLRRSAYSLPPIQPLSPKITSPMNAAPVNARTTAPILRKSFLKTLQTVSGFQIRMKSVFVPYVVIPGRVEDEGERREAGSEERTVVLSVELGNGSSSGGPVSSGFAVEGIDVTVGGEGAKANLIGWGENGFQRGDSVFPMLLGPAEQFNLLYAITFLRQSEADDVADTLRSEANGEKLLSPVGADKQRAVSIVIRGKPFDFWSSKRSALDDPKGLAYPTQTFRSRWNCVLDLASVGHSETFEMSSDPPSAQDALPAPASPFPGTPNTAKYPLEKSGTAHAVAGSKRHTIGGLSERGQRLDPTARYRNSTSILNATPSESPISATGGRFVPTPPSATIPGNARFASTTIAANIPSSHPGARTPDIPPPTPAYPAYPTESVPKTPAGQSPISNLRIGGAGHAIEPRREYMVTTGTPQTPGPRILGASVTDTMAPQDRHDAVDPVVVSVGLIPPEESAASNLVDVIYSLDTFGIEIFVFNRSERTRRFEVSYPDKKRRRQQTAAKEKYSMRDSRRVFEQQIPGILPLENRIRVGPLRPHTCQSVRMQFLALRAGVHSISCLTLTDVESGYSMNLK